MKSFSVLTTAIQSRQQVSRFLILLTLGFCFCDDEGSEPASYFEGVVSGTLDSGIAFEEEFRFEYPENAQEIFRLDQSGKLVLDLKRSGNAGSMVLRIFLPSVNSPISDLQVDRPSAEYQAVDFTFAKEVTSSSILEVKCSGFKYGTDVRSIGLVANQNYKFATDAMGRPLYKKIINYVKPGTVCCIKSIDYKFWNTAGDTIYYSYPGDYWLAKYEFSKMVSKEGVQSTTSALYQQLYLRTWGVLVFYHFLNGHLHEEFDPFGESGSLANIDFDSNTGRLKFDFNVTLNGRNPTNTTSHDLSLTGKFDSGSVKVYTTSVN